MEGHWWRTPDGAIIHDTDIQVFVKPGMTLGVELQSAEGTNGAIIASVLPGGEAGALPST